MKETFPIALSMKVYKALGAHPNEGWYSDRMEQALENAVLEWIDRQSSGTSAVGHVASVESGRIVYGGCSMSPSQFANLNGSRRRSAWRTLWVLMPDAPDWQRASALRDSGGF